MPLLAAILATFTSTLLGGLAALRASRRLGLLIALGAGVRIGAALFDLAPEAIDLLGSARLALAAVALGFLGFYVLERLTLLHVGHEAGAALEGHAHLARLGAGGMSLHSFLDGLAIGAALQAGPAIGLLVTIVVVVHDFSDGIGTVSVVLAHGGSRTSALRWLLIDAAAPVLGALAAFAWRLPMPALGLLLGGFTGFFLYVGAVELLPAAHRHDRSPAVILATLAGVALIATLGLIVVPAGS
jgi:ZIP family zinc transporter